MMKIKVYKLMQFGEAPQETYELEVPIPNYLIHMKVLHDGIYAWYEVPAGDTEGVETHRFRIVREGDIIPEGAKNVAVLDIVYNQEEEGDKEAGQAIIIFNIYQLKS